MFSSVHMLGMIKSFLKTIKTHMRVRERERERERTERERERERERIV